MLRNELELREGEESFLFSQEHPPLLNEALLLNDPSFSQSHTTQLHLKLEQGLQDGLL